MGKFSDTMRWLAREVRSESGKKDVIVNPCTFITGTCTGRSLPADERAPDDAR